MKPGQDARAYRADWSGWNQGYCYGGGGWGGYSYGNEGWESQQVKHDGYSQGNNDGSQNLSYSCENHSAYYCAWYGHGYADGQAQHNNNANSGQQQQECSSSSTSYSQSNPHITINNIITSSGVP
ncbi:MAG TPA: hypothetical protein VEL11_08450 [Candidatus Bathyarchaeia archaeon]|nr:hypothetical protein [Candidatus Bathyarchaeia archaeon]